MQTIVPTLKATTANSFPFQPNMTKIRQVSIKVVMVIPEIGFAELPIKPTMRKETSQNNNQDCCNDMREFGPWQERQEADNDHHPKCPDNSNHDWQIFIGS